MFILNLGVSGVMPGVGGVKPAKAKCKPTVQMKGLFWTVVEAKKVTNTIWEKV